MNEVFNRSLFFVREHRGIFKAANEYDVLDPESGQIVLECREPRLGLFTKMLRFTDFKRNTPFDVVLSIPNGPPVLRVERGVSLFVSRVKVLDENDHVAGGFQQKFFSLGGAFTVLDAMENPICELQGKWTSWEFSFARDGAEIAKVSKKWAGIGRELFTSADNYMLEISRSVAAGDPVRQLILGSVICIDMVLKE